MSSEMGIPPAVGTLAEYSEAPFERRTEWAQEGDVVRITGPEEDHHMVTHPDLVQRVLFSDNDEFVKFDGYESVFGQGIVSVYGDQWRAQRGAMQPAFVPDRVQTYAETMRRIIDEKVTTVDDEQTVDMRQWFSDLTMEVMLETLFGGAAGKKATISEAAERITEWFLETATAGDVPPEVNEGFDAGMDDLTSLIDEMVGQRDGSEDGDLLSMLIALGSDSEAGYTDDRIRDEMITMLFAAHETTSLTLTYTVFLLANAPRVESRLRRELDAVLGDHGVRPEHLDDLGYTERVIDEALRLYCPAHSLFRETTRDVTVGKFTIPEGEVVHLPQWVVHRDERWWDDPTTFRPERFAGDSEPRPFSYFPFGAGPRRCLGEDFARVEAKLAVAAFVDEFDFERETETFELFASLAAVPDRPVELSLERR